MTSTSWKSKLTTAVAAAVLAASMVPAAALGVTTLPLDDQISVGGLKDGDTAKFYRIVEQDLTTWDEGTPTHVGTQDWKWTTDVDKWMYDAGGNRVEGQDGIVDGSETGELKKDADGKLLYSGLTIDKVVIKEDPATLGADDKKKITYEMADQLAAALASNGATAKYQQTAKDGGIATVKDDPTDDDPLSGVYLVVATPGTNNVDTVYKPIFVSADFNEGDGTNSLTLVGDPATDYYVPENQTNLAGMFKRSDLGIDKKSGEYTTDGNGNETCSDTQRDVSVGDVVDFTVTTNVPTYSRDFSDAKFKITDVVTSGLKLSNDKGDDATADDITVTVEGYDGDKFVRDRDYKVTVTNLDQFVVEFLNDKNPESNDDTFFDVNGQNEANKKNDRDGFLYTVLGSPKVTITYKALVTSDAANINQMDNTVKLNFSNTLDDTEGHGELQDKTRHYTFNIDADIFGRDTIPGESQGGDGTNDNKRTSEVRKVVVKADGKIDESQTTYTLPGDPTASGYDWLEGAKFELKQTHEYRATDPANADASKNFVELDSAELIKFNGTTHIKDADGKNYVTSDAKGYIAMKGLDAGVYVLREIDAPLGYTFDPSISYRITITPTYVLENPSSTDTMDENEILSSYEVKVEKLENGEVKQTTISTYAVEKDAADETTPISFLNETFKTPSEYGNTTEVERTNIVKTTTTITLGEGSETALIVNKKLGILPATGGSGIIFYLVAGGLLAGTAAILINKDRKRSIA